MQLTPVDTNITNNIVLPQVDANTAPSYEQSLVSGPVPGQSDDITSSTFYGYLYNWCAATGGDPSTCTPEAIMPSDATQDICPANWRLPTGGATGEFAMLNAKMHDPAATAPSTVQYYANWQFDGPFQGVFAGDRRASTWINQGLDGNVWSSSHFLANSAAAHQASFSSSILGVGYTHNQRNINFSVRCMTQGITITTTPEVTFDTGAGAIQGTVTAWDDNSITVAAPAHSPGLVSVTVNNGVDSATLSAVCSSANATACNGRLDNGETRNGDRANVASGYLYEEIYLSLGLDSNLVQIGGSGGLIPTVSGVFASGSNALTTSTNNLKGYSLSISTDQTSANANAKDLKHLSLNQYINGTNNTCIWNNTTKTLTNTTSPLANNTWGFTISPANLALQQLCQVSAKDNPLTVKQTAAPNEAGDPTTVFFGAKVNMSKPSGKYQATIIYTVVTNS
jgi:uncharacterized protein (TIGR02145 family)